MTNAALTALVTPIASAIGLAIVNYFQHRKTRQIASQAQTYAPVSPPAAPRQ